MTAGNVKHSEKEESNREGNEATGKTILLEVSAAYNRHGLPFPRPNGPNGRRVLDMEMLLHHPFYWEWLNEKETTDVLMELYLARTRRTQ